MMGADLSRKTVSIYVDSEPAKISLQNLQLQADKLSANIAKGTAAGKSMITELAKLDKVNTQITNVQKQIDSGLRPSFNQLKTAAAQVTAEFNKMSQSDAGFAQKKEQVIALKTEMGNLSGQIKTVQTSSESFGGSFGKIFERVTEYVSAFAILEGVKQFFTGSIEEANKAELATVNLKNSLDNIGKGDLFDKLSASAEKFSETFKAINPNDIKNVFTKLIDYGKLSEDQMNQLIPVIINYAAKQKISLESATDVFTKAMEGNVKGLKTYGIGIGDAKTVTERFGLIVNDLGDKVKGAEAAFENTAQGGWAKLQERFVQIKEVIGGGLINGFNALIRVFQGSASALDQFNEKADSFSNLEKNISPLLDRVDELTSKTKLNKDEQIELNKAIEIIGTTIPVAITEFDKYGKAIGINTEKAREFIELQQDILKEKNRSAITEATGSLTDLQKQLDTQEGFLRTAKKGAADLFNVIEQTKQEGFKPTDNIIESFEVWNKKITEISTTIGELQSRIAGTKGIIDELSGTAPKVDTPKAEAGDPSVAARKAFLEAQIKKLQEGYQLLNAIDKTGQDANLAQQKIYQEQLDELLGKRNKANDEAAKKAEEQRKESLKRADEFNKQALDDIAKANEKEVQLLKDKYKAEADDQTKSLTERGTALTLYYASGLKLIELQKNDKQAELDFEIATDKKNAKSKEELSAIEALRIAKQADIDKQYALSTSDFKIEVDKMYTAALEKELKKQGDDLKEAYAEIYKGAAKSAKDKQNLIDINNDNKILALDQAFHDGKIKNLKVYQDKRQKLIEDGHKQDLQSELDALLQLQKNQAASGIATTDTAKAIADKVVEINTNKNTTTTADDKKSLESKLAFASFIISSAQQVAGILTDINDIKNAQDAQQLADNQQALTDDTTHLNRELSQKIISQTEYDRQIKALADKKQKEDAAVKEKEFERDRQAQIIQTIMSGAQAIVSTLAARPGSTDIISLGAFRAINIALAIATTAAQLAVISSQKPPTFGEGGLLNGPLHSRGGMPVINPATGHKVAEVEGGEPILSRKTYANNRALVDQLLYASMYGNGAPITPYWKQRSYQPINYTGVTRSMERIRHYERGGIFDDSSTVINNSSSQIPVAKLIDNLNASMAIQDALTKKLDQPFKAYTLITDVNAGQDLLAQIKKDTTISRN